MPVFFSNQTTNVTSAQQPWFGGTGTFYAQGTFGGATVVLETSFDNGSTWVAVPNTNFTVPAAINVELGQVNLRCKLTGASGTTTVTAGI